MSADREQVVRDALAGPLNDAVTSLEETYPEEQSLWVDLADLSEYDSDLLDDVLARPETMEDHFKEAAQDVADGAGLADIHIRYTNIPYLYTHTVGDFSPAEYIGRLIGLEGQITKRTEVQPKLEEAAFECVRCGTHVYIDQPMFGRIRNPHECPGCEEQGPFARDYDQSQFIDHQKIRLQQPPEDARGESENIDIHLAGDLTGDRAIEGGHRVTFSGKLVPVTDGTVVHDKLLVGSGFEREERTFEDIDTSEYAETIQWLKSHDNPEEPLRESFAPGHRGDELIKEALLLQLFGGWRREGPDGTVHRGDSHVLLIGDPGVGKTNLIHAMYDIAPRAVLTDGTGSSAAGLTASITKDDFSDEQWSIEAGTLVRAHNGIAAVDEIDKGETSDLEALHTALESQQVHVSKAGKNATLPAKAALLAAGNPTGGHFDPTAEFADQIDLQSPLLSRFDLIFTMTETVDEEKQRDIAEHMVASRQNAGRLARGEDVSEEDRAEIEADVETEAMAAYVSAAKDLQPVAENDEVEERMAAWFADMKASLPDRYSAAMDDGEYDGPPLPITARKLDALQRLAEARARMRYSETITMDDVEYVTQFIERTLADIGIAPNSNAALGRVGDIDPGEVGV